VSRENVDLYRQVGEAINSPDGVPEALLAPQFRIENIVTAVSDKTYYGAAGCREWLRDIADAYRAGARLEIEQIIADEDDFVIGRLAFAGTGARSGAPLGLRWIAVGWFHDGKATRWVGYANRRDAFKAVGLES
jgi:hypothetical protein